MLSYRRALWRTGKHPLHHQRIGMTFLLAHSHLLAWVQAWEGSSTGSESPQFCGPTCSATAELRGALESTHYTTKEVGMLTIGAEVPIQVTPLCPSRTPQRPPDPCARARWHYKYYCHSTHTLLRSQLNVLLLTCCCCWCSEGMHAEGSHSAQLCA